MAQPGPEGCGKDTGILGNGLFECRDGAFKFPFITDTNFDSITVGNDNARAFGWDGFFPFRDGPAKAENNLEVKKNQEVGPCQSCCNENVGDSNCSACQDACTTVNIDQVHIGDRNAQAFGSAMAKNNVKILLNQGT